VGPTAAGEIPDAQRRTLEGVAPWLAEVKPATVGRSTTERAGIRVTVPGADRAASTREPWWRAWRSPDGLVVVVDDPRTIVEVDGPVRVFALPDGPVRVFALPDGPARVFALPDGADEETA
jgi:alpha-L-fucosidase